MFRNQRRSVRPVGKVLGVSRMQGIIVHSASTRKAMKRIKKAGIELKKNAIVVALTANAVSGAKEMFISEGFDGFIAKPIYIPDFERVMLRVLPGRGTGKGGER